MFTPVKHTQLPSCDSGVPKILVEYAKDPDPTQGAVVVHGRYMDSILHNWHIIEDNTYATQTHCCIGTPRSVLGH